MVTASVRKTPPRIELQWPPYLSATNYEISRRTTIDGEWTPLTNLEAKAGVATGWVDTAVTPATVYEYQVRRSTGTGRPAAGFALSAIERPLVDTRGTLILIVDSRLSAAVSNELVRLQQDLLGDGWTVRRHDVEGKHLSDPGWKEAVTNVKATILADYSADPATVKAVFLLGHVPVPYSGKLGPDGHEYHQGAWPADVYYGDMDGTWTDTNTDWKGMNERQRNVPGDGKFDQSVIPAEVKLQVGRVDFYAMPCFAGKSETDLVRQYLDKDHAYRMKWVTAQRRGLVDDHFGDFGGESFAANGWRNFGSMFGASNVVEAGWFGTLARDEYLWAYACGGGDVELCGGVGRSADFAAADSKVVFTMLFGSFFGDWDQPNDILRVVLGMPTYTLTCSWGSRPDNFYHFMTLGETVGESLRRTQNRPASRHHKRRGEDSAGEEFPDGQGPNRAMVHLALMGDPSLRLHVVAPVSGLNGEKSRRRVQLRWTPSPDDGIAGYHVYRAKQTTGPYVRLTGAPVDATSFTDKSASGDEAAYMVRPVKLEVSPSGSYWNIGQGVFVTVGNGLNHVPVADSQTATVAEEGALSLTLAARDPDGDALTYSLAQRPQHGTVTGQLPNAIYTPSVNYFGPDRFGFQASDGRFESAMAPIAIVVTPVNHAPVSEPQQVKVAQDDRVGLTLRATDVEGDPLTYRVVAGPEHGSLSGNPPALTYAPTPGYAGPDGFTFCANDGQTNGAAARVTIAVLSLRDPENPVGCTNGLVYEEYLGVWTNMPDFNTLTPHSTGTVAGLSLDVREKGDNFGIRYRGYLRVPTNGMYTFYTTSDDGSKLAIGNEEVVNNDGIHGTQERAGQIALKSGVHACTVTFFQGTGGASLSAAWQAPGLGKESIPNSSWLRRAAP